MQRRRKLQQALRQVVASSAAGPAAQCGGTGSSCATSLKQFEGLAMSEVAAVLPCRRAELVSVSHGEVDAPIVRDRGSGASFELGRVEHFLLARLDGTLTVEGLRAAFQRQFGEELSERD